MASDTLRQDMVDQVREEQQQRQRAPRVHRIPKADPQAASRGEELPEPDESIRAPSHAPADASALGSFEALGAADDGAPRKRRRRRRSGAAKGTGDTGNGSGGADHGA